MRVVLGIGNPEEKYAETRHNVGWKVVETLSGMTRGKFRKAGFEFWAAEGKIGRHEVALVKTWTYVNETGRAIPDIRRRYGEEILVVCDDVHLPLGSVRVRAQGSDGGHNGLKSIEAALGHANYPRLRIGVGGGRPDPGYVLGRFRKEERPVVEDAVAHAAQAVRCWVEEGIQRCMTRFNRRMQSENV